MAIPGKLVNDQQRIRERGQTDQNANGQPPGAQPADVRETNAGEAIKGHGGDDQCRKDFAEIFQNRVQLAHGGAEHPEAEDLVDDGEGQGKATDEGERRKGEG